MPEPVRGPGGLSAKLGPHPRALGAGRGFSPAEDRSAGNPITLAASVQMGLKHLFSKGGLETRRVPETLSGRRAQTVFMIILQTDLPFSVPFSLKRTLEFLSGYVACEIEAG